MVMRYAPHTLQALAGAVASEDGFGRPLAVGGGEWTDVCRCRCDSNWERELRLDNGQVVKPDWHVVCEGNDLSLKPGDTVRCVDRDGTVRASGRILRMRTNNYLPYGEIYL